MAYKQTNSKGQSFWLHPLDHRLVAGLLLEADRGGPG